MGYTAYQAPIIDASIFKYRERAVQHFLEEPNTTEDFEGCQFIAYILKDMKITTTGQLDVTFSISPNFRPFAQPLETAQGVPLSVDVQLWTPFKNAIKED